MASYESINFSLRPSKCVQREIVFGGLKSLSAVMNLRNPLYIGLGSIWFTDFVMAHKVLEIDDMISMEANEVGFRRANFNKTYRSISVFEGQSSDLLPKILDQAKYQDRSWIVWLDYDSAMDEDKVEEMRWLLLNIPPNSIVLFTFSAKLNAYGDRPSRRVKQLIKMLGSVIPNDLSGESCNKANLPLTLAKYTTDFLNSVVADHARQGDFINCFKIRYFDSVEMVTVGGVLPTLETKPKVRTVVTDRKWKGLVDEMIKAPPMTLKEVATLQAELPCDGELTRARVKELGFDLLEDQIRSFQRYYKHLPSFAEIVT